MKTTNTKQRILITLLSIGLVTFPVHNKLQPFFEQGVFLPHIAFALIAISVSWLLLDGEIEFGPKAIWIPLAIIVLSMWLRIIVAPTMRTLSGACFGLVLFGCYLCAIKFGAQVLIAFVTALILQCTSAIAQAATHPGCHAAGLVTTPVFANGTPNYDIAIGYTLYEWLLCKEHVRGKLSLLTVPATILAGAGEGLIGLSAIFSTIVIRKDKGKYLWALLLIVVLMGTILVASGKANILYHWSVIGLKAVFNPQWFEESTFRMQGESPLGQRLEVISIAMRNLKPLGNGYEVVKFTWHTVHNVPLIIVDQLGIAAAAAWLWVSLYCLFKTNHKYLWIGTLALCLFDHFVWTQLAPWWWIAVGLSIRAPQENDLIFRRQDDKGRDIRTNQST